MGYLATIRTTVTPAVTLLERIRGDIRFYQMHSFRKSRISILKRESSQPTILACWRVRRTQFGKETIPELVDLHAMHIQSFRELRLGNKTSTSMHVCECCSDTHCFFDDSGDCRIPPNLQIMQRQLGHLWCTIIHHFPCSSQQWLRNMRSTYKHIRWHSEVWCNQCVQECLIAGIIVFQKEDVQLTCWN